MENINLMLESSRKVLGKVLEGGGDLRVLPKIRPAFIYCHYSMISVSFDLLVNIFTN